MTKYSEAYAADPTLADNLDGKEVIGYTTSPDHPVTPVASGGMRLNQLASGIENLTRSLARLPGSSIARVSVLAIDVEQSQALGAMSPSAGLMTTISAGILTSGFSAIELDFAWSRTGNTDSGELQVGLRSASDTANSPGIWGSQQVAAGDTRGSLKLIAHVKTDTLLVGNFAAGASITLANSIQNDALIIQRGLDVAWTTDQLFIESITLRHISALPQASFVDPARFPVFKNLIEATGLINTQNIVDGVGSADWSHPTANFTLSDGEYLQGSNALATNGATGPWVAPAPGEVYVLVVTGIWPVYSSSSLSGIRIGNPGQSGVDFHASSSLASNNGTGWLSVPDQKADPRVASGFKGAIAFMFDVSTNLVTRVIAVDGDTNPIIDSGISGGFDLTTLVAWDQKYELGRDIKMFAAYNLAFSELTPAELAEGVQWMADNHTFGLYAGWHGET